MICRKFVWAKLGLWLLPFTLVLGAVAVPVIGPIPDVELLEDVYCDGVGYTVSDPEFADNLMALGVTVHSSNPSLIPDENMKVIRAGYSGLITLQPVHDAFGTAIITATVTNPNGASASTTFTYTVVPQNDPPTLDPLPDMVLTSDAAVHAVPLAGITTGATNEFQDLVLTAYAHPPGILTNLQITYTTPDPTGTLSFEIVSNATGKVLVDVFVDDGWPAYNIIGRNFHVQVDPTNLPPTISAIADQMTDLDTPKVINFTIGDKETSAEGLAIITASSDTALVPDENVAIDGFGSNWTATITPAAGQSGYSLLTVAVIDTDGNEALSSFSFTVKPDAFVPVISSQPQSQKIGVGATARLSVSAVGEEPFTYQWQHNGTDLSLQTNSTLEITNVQPTDIGDYAVVVTNSKGTVTSSAAQLQILSVPNFTQITHAHGTALLSFNTLSGLTYSVEYKNSLNETNWNLLESRAGTGELVVVSDLGAKWDSRYYRLRVD